MKKNCTHCGKEFEAERSNTKYCKRGCSTMACNKRKGLKTGLIPIEGKRKELVLENPPQVVAQGINGIEMGRAADVVTELVPWKVSLVPV